MTVTNESTDSRYEEGRLYRTIEGAGLVIEYSLGKARLVDIERVLAEKDLRIARFYLSQERTAAAEIYLSDAVRRYPDARAGVEAQALLSDLRGSGQ